MKKLLPILIIIIGIVFVAGCIGGEKAIDSKSSTYSQTNQESETQTPELIIKPGDVPGLTMSRFYYISFPISGSLIEIDSKMGHFRSMSPDMRMYEDNLPLGTRNVGQDSYWNGSGQQVQIRMIKFDSNPKFNEGYYKTFSNNCVNKGFQNLGDITFCDSDSLSNSPDVKITSVRFIYKKYFIFVYVTDEKDKSESEALRISKIIKSRLD